MTKELLFSVTAKDCKWDYFRGTGPGGQKRNKTESGVRCTHPPSGAIAECDETRDQRKNRQIAFTKMANTKEFKVWHRIEIARLMGDKLTIEEKVDKALDSRNIRTEIKVDGKWTIKGND